ncbi:sodium-dependent lysophosphatidylcholine symporter 1-B-like isoform X1 [Takifugu flavidus]|uniref:sodium-dependent lysophosphatidylcholine symporter 1-B-like isoform X1 n=1 Tax=Takifugu flavidus TaxID=433684 RepID=UPI0025442681|nr:sodium-dependent lysophosphatidylcholine symporter 1-B-like isoform X1 [Takifugu flavidus]
MSCLKDFKSRVETMTRRFLTQAGDGQQRSGGIPLIRKICYALGGVPNQVTTAAMAVSLQIFLLDVVQMEAFYVSLVLFVSRAWDAVTDPLIGYLVGRSRWTSAGKLSPWLATRRSALSKSTNPLRPVPPLSRRLSRRLVLSTPFAVLSYLLLWFVPPGAAAGGVLWFLVTTCLFETLMSCYHVPYLSLNMFLGGDHRDRDSATAYRMTTEMLAMLMASVIQGKVVVVYNTERQEVCQHLEEDAPASTTPSPQIASLVATRRAFLTSAVAMGAVFFVCSLVLFLGVKEQKSELSAEEHERPSYLAALRMLLSHIPYQRLVLSFVFFVLAFQMSLGNFALFCSHAAELGAQYQYLILVLLVAASVAVPLWQVVLLRIGKKATVFLGLSLFIPAVIIVACVPSSLPVFLSMCVLMGFSVATIFLLPWSMLPDVVDDFASKHPSCKGLEPLFFSCYAFCNKLAGSLSAGISAMMLQFVGYRSGACSQDEGVRTVLIVLFAPVPVVLLLVGMAIFRSYPIHERKPLRLRDVTSTTQPEAASSSTAVRRDPEEPTGLQEPPAARAPDPLNHNVGSSREGSDPPSYSKRSNVTTKVTWV